jgi:hypothetical protein
MRVFGDLNPPESHEPNDPSRTGSTGKNGNLNENEKPEQDSRKAFAGGVLPDNPTTHPHSDAQSRKHPRDRIGDQRLEPAGDTKTPAHLPARRTDRGGWFVLMVLTLGLLGAAAYGYLTLRNDHVNLGQVPGLLGSITTLGGRVDAAESKLRDLAANAGGLTSHLAELDHKIDSSLSATRNQTREMVSQAVGHLQAELDQRGQAVDARLRNVESTQRQDQARLAQLNEQLRGQVAGLREELAAAQQTTGRDLANVQEQVSNDQGDLRTLTQSLHRDKMTFELVKNSPTELAPGVTLTILKTDVSYQRVNGYITLTSEGKTLWLKNLNAKEAVDLYSQQYSHPYSLIVTTVNDDGVAGYLLLPAGV